jgi:hypothetical protein
MNDLSNGLITGSNGNLVRWMHVTPAKQDIESADRLGLIQAMPAARFRRRSARPPLGPAGGVDARCHHLQPQQPLDPVLRERQSRHHRCAYGANAR